MQKEINMPDGSLILPQAGMMVECQILENANIENIDYVKERIVGDIFIIKEVFDDGIILLESDNNRHIIPVLPVYCVYIPDQSVSNQQPMEATMQEQQPAEQTNFDNIDYSEMVKALAKPGQAIVDSLTAEKAHLWHMATGVSGETGELLESIEESFQDITCVPTIDRVNVVEELGDTEFYVEGIRQGTGITREETISPAPYRSSHDLLVLTALLAVAGSALLDAVKKSAIYNKEMNRADVVIALSKLEFYMNEIRNHDSVMTTREEVLSANKAKLGKRYASLTYSDSAAQARADKVA